MHSGIVWALIQEQVNVQAAFRSSLVRCIEINVIAGTNPGSPMHSACAAGHLSVVQVLLSTKVIVNLLSVVSALFSFLQIHQKRPRKNTETLIISPDRNHNHNRDDLTKYELPNELPNPNQSNQSNLSRYL